METARSSGLETSLNQLAAPLSPKTGMGLYQRLEHSLSRLQAPAFSALRMVAGAAFWFHGMRKIFGWLTNGVPLPEVGTQIWFGGLIELICGALIAFGLLTRPAAFLASGTMAVAYVQFHWQFAFADSKWLPAINQGEPALIYAFLFLFIAAHGAGPASIDRVFRRA